MSGSGSNSDYNKQKEILRSLAKEVAEISALPVQDKTLKAWKGLNSLKPVRPMFMIDQLPWGEMNNGGELDCVCGDDWLLKSFEWQLRETLYRWRYIQDDRVVENIIRVPKAVSNTGFGMQIIEDRIAGNAGTAADSHDYKDILRNEEDIEKIKTPEISENKEESRRRLEIAEDIFGDIMRVNQTGVYAEYGHVWDVVSTWHGIEECMYDILDRPEFIHKILDKMFGLFLGQLDRYEKLGLINAGNPNIHCTGAYCDELPGFNGESEEELEKFRYSAKNIWTMGAAQLFSMVSPEVHDEFEIYYQKKWYERFGLGYYG